MATPRLIATAAASSTIPFEHADIEQSIPARFAHVVGRFPDHIALTASGRRWTYAEVDRWTNRIARAIRAQAPSDSSEAQCVAILAGQSPEMVAMTLAVLKAGKTYLGIHPEMPAAAQRDILLDAAPRLVLATSELLPRARAIAAGVCSVLSLDEIDGRYPDDNLKLPIDPGDPSTIFYTSGTTGKPKGVVKSHRAVLHRVWLSTRHDVIVPADRQSLLTHASFSASESDMFCALLQGARICVFDISSEGFPAFAEWIDAEQITLLHPPVLLFRRFLSTLEGANHFPSIRQVALAGDSVVPADVWKWRRHFAGACTLLHRFSTAETALLTVARIEREEESDPEAVLAGRAVADKLLTLVDDTGCAVPAGESGELVVRSRYLADGYWRHPEETVAAFQPDPDVAGQRMYRTGDRGKFLPDGSFVFLGRRLHLAKIRGYRVDAREVESALTQLDEVSVAAVVVRKDRDADQLSAFVVMKHGLQFDAGVLRERLRTQLPEWKIPQRLQPIAALPLTLSGKVDRQLLESIQPSAVVAEPEAPGSSSIEKELTDIWLDVLRCGEIAPDDHFFDLGGDSIATMTILARVERMYRVRLTLAEFFQNGTIRQLAAFVRKNHGPGERQWTPRPGGPFELLFIPGDMGIGVWRLAQVLNEGPTSFASVAPLPDASLQAASGFKISGLPSLEELAAAHTALLLSRPLPTRFVLAGYSFGALLAFEVAHQLRREGRQVEMILLLDPWASIPPWWKKLKILTWARARNSMNALASGWWSRTRARFEGRTAPDPEGTNLTDGEAPWNDLQSIYRNARKSYKCRRLDTRAILFRAQKSDAAHLYSIDGSMGWGGLFTGGLQIIEVPGDHTSILTTPHMLTLARRMQECLERLRNFS